MKKCGMEAGSPKGVLPGIPGPQKISRLTRSRGLQSCCPKAVLAPRPGDPRGSCAAANPGPEGYATWSSQPVGEGLGGLQPAIWEASSSRRTRLLSASPEGAGEGRSVAPPGPQQHLGQCMAAQGPLERIIKFPARESTSLIARTAPPRQGGLLQPKGPHTSSILCHVKGHRIYGREPGLTSKA